MSVTWKAPQNVQETLDEIKTKFHPELDQASIVVAFADSKPYSGNQFNFGKTQKFSDFNKIWQSEQYDYCIVISADVWHSILNNEQRMALLDLHLCRCEPEYEPETITDKGRKQVVKDEWGRVKYTSQVKLDDDGNPKWKLLPLDLYTFAKNVSRYGLWCEELVDFGGVVSRTNGFRESA